jgi:hypothetical protein
MKIEPIVEKVCVSNEFKNFIKENPDSVLVAGFFVIDNEMKNTINQIDYYVPSSKKVAAFTLDEKIVLQVSDLVGDKIPEILGSPINIDLDALEGIIEDEMKNRGYTEKINKIIAVIQKYENKNIWSLSCILSGMEILKAHIDDDSKTVLKMEKLALSDVIKMVPNPNSKFGKMQTAQKDDTSEKIKKIDALEKQLESEKKKLIKSSKSKSSKKK